MDDVIGKSFRVAARKRRQRWLGVAVLCTALGPGAALAQTSFGAATSVVFPVVAATATFTGQVTLYNPNGSDITVALDFFEANTVLPPATPGSKPCTDVVVPANSSVQFLLATQCTLGDGSHYGLLVASDTAGTNLLYGYSRTQVNAGRPNAGAGFSIEGFPIGNFTTQTSYSTGLAGSPTGLGSSTYQTNCFVDSLADPVTYDLKLFDGTTGTQIGSTISGSLGAFEQVRYLNVFNPAPDGVNAPAGDYSNVRAEFTRTSAGTQVLIGFCTVQDATLNADFRVAKSPAPPAPPVPPPTTPTATWSGQMVTLNANQLSYIFMGPTAQVTLAAPSTVTAYGSGGFERNNGGADPNISVGVCYQDQVGPGPITLMPSATGASVPKNTLVPVLAVGSASLAAGTYNVSLCATNSVNQSVNASTVTSGFVFVTP